MFKEFIGDRTPNNRILKEIYLLIQQFGPISKAELLEKMKLKPATLTDKIDELLKKDYILECGRGPSTGGRPPILYHIKSTCSYMVGIQIIRFTIKIVLVDLLYNVIEKEEFLVTALHTPHISILKIKETIQSFLEKYQIAFDQLLGIGIGAVGMLDRTKGIIVLKESPFAPGWENVHIVETLKKEFPVRIILENASDAAVLAKFKNVSPQVENILYCISSRVIGCGVITNGELIRSKTENTSIYDHMVIDINGRQCSCGKRGCLISYTSPYSVMKEVKGKYSTEHGGDRNLEEAPIDDIIQFLKQENVITKDNVLKSAFCLGVGVANIVNLLDTEFVILDGPLINEYPNYYEKVVESLNKHLDKRGQVRISKVTSGDNAIAVGAGIFVFYSFNQT
ncbi:ROK family transcriptional regulator [Salipaludibacillus sp. CF4.18]|uniref:ROK family transcriptional regulator n=1 Tax=Salipaludibacillus sp. CF4.18 TaxID=3373081 RepID=UPI003EE5CC2E